MAKMYRCYQCEGPNGVPGRDFVGDKPVCPECKIDGDDPRVKARGLVVQLKVIHFDAPTKVKGLGVGHAACNPALKVGTVRASGVPEAVNCPGCRASEAWKAEDRRWSFNPEDDVELNIDPRRGVITKAG